MKHFVIFSLLVIISMFAAFFIIASTYGIAAYTAILTVLTGCVVFVVVIGVLLAIVSMLDNDRLNDVIFN